MKSKEWLILEEELGNRNQFKKLLLTDEIVAVRDCDAETAFKDGKGHCNMLSLYAILKALGMLEMNYAEFYDYCLMNKLASGKPYCTEKGYLNIDKSELLNALSIDADITKYKTIPADCKPGDMYQVSINGNHHFIACLVGDDFKVYLFDTNDRGIGVEIGKAFSRRKDKPDWFKKIENRS